MGAFEREIKTLRGTADGLDRMKRQPNQAPGVDRESTVVVLTSSQADLMSRTLEVIAARLEDTMNPVVYQSMQNYGVTIATGRMGSDARGETFRVDEPSLEDVIRYVERRWGKTVS
jgi:L-aminopeptidase/D-esterase-like protein